jgi:hypothetical protein
VIGGRATTIIVCTVAIVGCPAVKRSEFDVELIILAVCNLSFEDFNPRIDLIREAS